MKYRVLRPEFAKTFEKNEHGQPIFRVKEWTLLGLANSMAEAKKFHRTPVLEAV